MAQAVLPAVISRLRTQAPRFTGRVYLAADLDQLRENERKAIAPEAFVLLLAESSDLATVTQEFGVVVALDARADVLGEDPAEVLEHAASEVIEALEGWSASSEHRPAAYQGASLISFSRAVLLWQLNFTAIRERAAVVRYELGLVATLDVGASVPTVLGLLAGVVTTAIPGAVRFASDYLENLERALAAGGTGFQLAAIAGTRVVVNSNITRQQISIIVRIFRRLSVGESERAYTEAAMQTELAALLNPDAWKVAGIHELVDEPSMDFPGDLARL